jgi:hypothetical protein
MAKPLEELWKLSQNYKTESNLLIEFVEFLGFVESKVSSGSVAFVEPAVGTGRGTKNCLTQRHRERREDETLCLTKV